eukprot:m.147409 g.147409  ORF g.147409 m.147409 type:complete len:263 (+) comp17285_c1_seq1:1974-2762(+)
MPPTACSGDALSERMNVTCGACACKPTLEANCLLVACCCALSQVMLERVVKLYNIESFRAAARKVLADQILSIFEASPRLIVDLRKDLLEFIGNRRNVGEGKEEFFVHVVWIIGEYAAASSDPRCTTEILEQYYNVLELFAYEVNRMLQSAEAEISNPAYQAVHTTRLMTILMLALAKLGTRCQDLIPRVLLTLTKIIKQHSTRSSLDIEGRHAIVERASQLVATLQHPSIAAAVLVPPPHASKTAVAHNDPTSSLSLLPWT